MRQLEFPRGEESRARGFSGLSVVVAAQTTTGRHALLSFHDVVRGCLLRYVTVDRQFHLRESLFVIA
jgi:hypothetical protein